MQRDANRKAVLTSLDYLSHEEIYFAAKSLRSGTPTFYTYVHSPAVGIMVGKGLVWTTGGQHNRDQYPFSFHDFVWEALLDRKAEFIAKDEERKRQESASR